MLLSQVITWTATFLLIIHLPRSLGAAGYGQFNFATSFMAIFALFIDFGTTTLVTREVARDRARASAYLTNVLVLKTVTALIAYVALMGTIVLLRRPPEIVHLMYILGIGMVLASVSKLLDSILQGFEKVHYHAWGEVMDKVLGTAIILALLARGFGLSTIIWSMTVVQGIHIVRSAYWVLRLVRPRLSLLKLGFSREVMSASLPFFLFAVFARVYDKIDVTMLGLMTSDEVVGWYGAAYRLFGSLFFIPHIFYTVTFPVLSRLWAQNPRAYHQAVHRGFALLSAAAVGVCVSTLMLAGPVVDLLYTQEKFPGTATALRVLALALLLQYLNTMVVMVLQTTDRQSQWMRAGAVAAAVNPAINYLLIPIFGHIGAAITTVLTEAMLITLAFRACPAGIFSRADGRVLGRSLLAGALLAAGLWFTLRWGMAVAVLLNLPLYLFVVLRLGVVSQDDLLLIQGALLSKLQGRKEAA